MRSNCQLPTNVLSVRDVLGESTTTNIQPVPYSSESFNPKTSDSTCIVWYRGHDLRVNDHAALDAAVKSGANIVALYVLERGSETEGTSSYTSRIAPRSEHSSLKTSFDTSNSPDSWGPLSANGSFALGNAQRLYLHNSLSVLQQKLQELGITLLLRKVDYAAHTSNVILSVAKALNAEAVFWNRRHKPRAYQLDDAVKSGLAQHNIISQDLSSELLFDPDDNPYGQFDDFQSYSRFWLNLMRTNPPSIPNQFLKRDDVSALSKASLTKLLTTESCITNPGQDENLNNPCFLPSIDDLELLKGIDIEKYGLINDTKSVGCVAAHDALKTFLSEERFGRFSSNEARRDGMVQGSELATSRLSPYIRFGEISPRVLFYAIVDAGVDAKKNGNTQRLNAARQFLRNISLREFGYHVLFRHPSASFKPIMPEFEVFPWEQDENRLLTNAWEAGKTGFPLVDAAMRQLLREGWLHNKMRFLAASFYCKYLLLPWPIGAAHMVRTLIDGDEACNSLGWQWTVGCNTDSFPFSTLVNPLSVYTTTRSLKTAAKYVRKYVPELARLPDSLILTPWRVTPADCIKYNFQMVPLSTYNDNLISNQLSSVTAFYPKRIITCKFARIRARNAMDVMRRIFSSQRMCRTFIAEQLPEGYEEHIKTQNDGISYERRVSIGENGLPMILGVEPNSLNEETSLFSDITSLRGTVRRQANDTDNIEYAPPAKRQRRHVTSSNITTEKRNNFKSSETLTKGMKPTIDLTNDITSICTGNTDNRDKIEAKSQLHPVPAERVNTTSVGRKSGSESRKRPRSSSLQEARQSDKRVSVRSLVSPTNFAPQTFAQSPSSANGHRLQGLQPMVQEGGCNTLTASNIQLPKSNTIPAQSNLNVNQGSSSMYPYSMANLVMQSPGIGLSPMTNSAPSPTPRDPHDPQFQSPVSYESHESTLPPQGTISPSIQGTPVAIQPSGVTAREAHVNDGHMQAMQNASMHMNTPILTDEGLNGQHNFNMRNSQIASMYHTNAQALPLVPAAYHPIQAHNNQIVLSYRQAQSAIPVNHSGHPQTQPHSQAANQNYFAAPFNVQPNQANGQPVVWYSAIQPYMDLRNPALQGAMLPQVMHPMARPHPGIFNYSFGRNGAGPSNDHGISTSPTNIIPNPGSAALVKRGPSNPMEREAIARRMAAMDYHDETYGGKHWEQWQAISLHLLNQYEFSEDTDRETSKAYVRLCVLKDELRDANPSGPRVTVHHCKEVFRILCLPVTGEWDRRGHGGVRGPYCYGCVKRRGARLPK